MVARAGGGAGREDAVDPLQILRGKPDLEGADILLEIFPPLGARDGDYVVALGEDPGDGELGGGAAFLGRHRLDLPDEGDVPLEILAGEARVEAAVIVV